MDEPPNIAAYEKNGNLLYDGLIAAGFQCQKPQGAFYLFPCIKKFGLSSDEFANEILKEQKLAVVPGSAFGRSGEGFLRISYAYSLESLERAMDRMQRFIENR